MPYNNTICVLLLMYSMQYSLEYGDGDKVHVVPFPGSLVILGMSLGLHCYYVSALSEV